MPRTTRCNEKVMNGPQLPREQARGEAGPSHREPVQHHDTRQPRVIIVEEPARKDSIFRYEQEARADWLQGIRSTPTNKTFPSIRIDGVAGPVKILLLCLTEDLRVHPHSVVMDHPQRNDTGVVSIHPVLKDRSVIEFKNLAIIRATKQAGYDQLRKRRDYSIDPFRKGFEHISDGSKIDLNVVRLCFQVFLPDETGKCRRPLKPIFTQPVVDKRAKTDLVIYEASACSGTAKGGTKLLLLCEKVSSEDRVVFFLEERGMVVWRQVAGIQTLHRHNKAISLLTPSFREAIIEAVNVQFRIENSKDGLTSNSCIFTYSPDYTDVRYKTKELSNLLRSYCDRNTSTFDLFYTPRAMESHQVVSDMQYSQDQAICSHQAVPIQTGHPSDDRQSCRELFVPGQFIEVMPSTQCTPQELTSSRQSSVEEPMSTSIPVTVEQLHTDMTTDQENWMSVSFSEQPSIAGIVTDDENKISDRDFFNFLDTL
ncbi:embryonic polarity protein dorsal-like [Anticarsia gemmatalis]|uniref:embryonic polarity protein dorsal-like n=1 Tax=Anticarsia gemmatalis TaxID=129554 RepID=UPI003F7600A9